MTTSNDHHVQPREYPEPKISKMLFASKASAPFWTIVRLYLGYLWLQAGWGKVTSSAWVGPNAGGPVTGFLNRALERTGGEHPSVSGWYAWLIENVFLPNATIMSNLVAIGEVLVGVALILGFLTGISAFFGGLLNASFLLAGTVSSNPTMFILATWLVLAWRVAGYYGLDYWVLPRLGAPQGNFGRKEDSGDGGGRSEPRGQQA
ncbi:MAG: TQO small subunit DoxD [Trueperaceae bacterium]|nr:TQO small subunit DoxD [Trueperaceae bacterium]